MTRRYTAEISIIIGPDKDIPAPDVNTNEQIMGWIMDTYSMTIGYSCPGVVTGKPIDVGGSLGRKEATGRGVFYVTRELSNRRGFDLRKAPVAIQGFGNVGSNAAKIFAEHGCKVVGISDVGGGLYDAKGLDIDDIMALPRQARDDRRLRRRPSTSDVDKFLEVPCDILIPAAMENSSRTRTRPASRPSTSSRAPTAPPPTRPTASSTSAASWWSPTSWPTPAA